jgi:hypothetical protein
MELRRTLLTAIMTAVVGAALAGCGTTAATTAVTQTTPAGAGARPAGAGAQRDGVPWSEVGAGWVLAQYVSAQPEGGKSGPVTLYLISPDGTRYKVAHWPNSRTSPQLVAWSPDGKRALFQIFSGKGGTEVLTLATGQASTFVLPGAATPIGFTTPDGLNIVGGRLTGSGTDLARYSLSGALTQPLGNSTDGQVLYEPSGAGFLTGASYGLRLASNGGALIRKLPVPGTSSGTCNPIRWWNSGTVLAACPPPGTAAPQLWLVPVNGARPTALTPPRSFSSGDLGDVDAWQLASGLYVQAAGPCAVLQIFKQAANGSITLVKVPNTNGDNRVLTATGSRLLIQAPTGCTGSVSLLWFDPATHAEQWLVRAPANVAGVEFAIPFYGRENGDL